MRRLLLALLLLGGAAAAQTPSFVPLTPFEVPSAARLNGNWLSRAPLDADGTVSSVTVRPGAGTVASPLAVLLAEHGHTPDWYKQVADGTDDAPSVQRAINVLCAAGGGHLRFRPRHYVMATPVTQGCAVSWAGHGWREPNYGDTGTMLGTWLDFAVGAFGSGGTTSPVTISGNAASGSAVRDFAVTQPVALPAVGDTSWTPPDTPPLFLVENTNSGVAFERLLFRGVNRGIRTHIASRVVLSRIYGQAWRVLAEMDKSYDAGRGDEIHYWSFLTTDNRVMAWTQANATALLTRRSDTPLIGRMFVFGARSGIRFDSSASEGAALPGGATTGMAVSTISCDYVLTCLDIAATGVTAQVALIRSYAQTYASVSGTPVMIPGSSVIDIPGQAYLQIGALENFGTDTATIRASNTVNTSNIQVGSALVRTASASTGAVLANFASVTGAYHTLNIAAPPMFPEALPSGWAALIAGSNGSLSWPGFTTPGSAWTSATVTLSCGSGSLTSATGTLRYRRGDHHLTWTLQVSITTNGTCAGDVRAALPAGMVVAATAAGGGREVAAVGAGLVWQSFATANTIILNTSAASYPGGNGYLLVASGTVELTDN